MDRMLVVVFDSEREAYEGPRILKELHAGGSITLYGQTVIAKDASGKVTVKAAEDSGPLGTAVGMVTGALDGLIGGPVGVAVGMAAGTFGGAMYDLATIGVGENFLNEAAGRLEPGTAAVVAEIQEEWILPVDTRMEAAGGTVFRRGWGDVVDAQIARDVAFNNAGIETEAVPLVKCTRENWDRVVAINLTGVFLALQYELEPMLPQGRGAIVNTTSLAGLTGPALAGAYAASKWGVIGLTRVAANEHARFGIRVNAVAPGFTLTSMLDRDEAMMPGWKQAQIDGTPMHRGADPLEIARAVVWLASDDASFVTGQPLAVDGGVTAGGSALTENPLNFMSRG